MQSGFYRLEPELSTKHGLPPWRAGIIPYPIVKQKKTLFLDNHSLSARNCTAAPAIPHGHIPDAKAAGRNSLVRRYDSERNGRRKSSSTGTAWMSVG